MLPTPPKLAVLCDYQAEGWPSMDLCAEMLLRHLQPDGICTMQGQRFEPAFRRYFTRLPIVGERRFALNGDRLLNRYWFYPQALRQQPPAADFFHICDHSYAHLVHHLPSDRTGVFCHDLDAFRSLLEPEQEPRPTWYQAIARHILSGMQKAAIVFYASTMVRQGLERHHLVDPQRLVQAVYGIAPEFCLAAASERSTGQVPPFVLHVGSCIPRKRIDVLLEVFARLRQNDPDLTLVKVGGEWSAAQQKQMDRLQIRSAIRHLTNLSRSAIADLYRRAAVVLQPSEAEGFGLPVVEALACGAIVVASDLPVLREIGGSAVLYCPVGDIAAWVATVSQTLHQPNTVPPLAQRLAVAEVYSWQNHAAQIAQAYAQRGACR